MIWVIEFTPKARLMLLGILDRRIREKIIQSIDHLKQDPEKQGKPLTGELMGFRSLRAVGQRYRIIYQVKRDRVIILVVAIGIRKEGDRRDIYSLARRLVQLGLG